MAGPGMMMPPGMMGGGGGMPQLPGNVGIALDEYGRPFLVMRDQVKYITYTRAVLLKIRTYSPRSYTNRHTKKLEHRGGSLYGPLDLK